MCPSQLLHDISTCYEPRRVNWIWVDFDLKGGKVGFSVSDETFVGRIGVSGLHHV